ncbi:MULTISPECIES: efflux RND transporter periplasmic adaptor subunit [Asticcacaulis]|uniref:efflux RND transporter periplasmic adaptor subunit n=1 Tax=Asticcacaulis TaxID=76890 RepID=UPI001FD9EC73|nr:MULTISPECIES: HlyD family efflux transporter periplasmic adaptor subunit [Asticcacaulis]MBP2159188.1 HlyD family secretion protein [Asticcacaulis solisilvae]MDR6800233.1 HlyD family secretion protein [Asticcacaulis sp. BE141]
MPDTTSSNAPTRKMDRALTRPWYRKRPFQIGAVAAIVAAVSLALFLLRPASNTVDVNADTIDSGEVVRAAYQDYVPLRAEVVPLVTVFITAEAAGRVESVAADDGVRVVAGQPLARLSNPSLTLEVSTREADISARLSDSTSQLMNLQTQGQAREQTRADVAYALHKAEQELTRRRTLRDQGVINDAALKVYADEADYQRSRLATLKASEAQEAAFYQSQRQAIMDSAADLRRSLTEVRKGLTALTIAAPTTGRLTGFDLKPGQAVTQSLALGQVDSEGTYKLRAQVDEYYLQRLTTGLKAQARLHNQTVDVHVSKVFPQVANGRITVELEFDSAVPADLKRGEAADIRLQMSAGSEVATLAPSGSWLADTNGTSVFVVNAKGDKASRRTVTIGRRNPEYVEVLSGLKPGERIIVAGTSNYQKAQHLRLKKSA